MASKDEVVRMGQPRRSRALRWALLAASGATVAQVGCEPGSPKSGCCESGNWNADWCGPKDVPPATTTTPTGHHWTTTTTTSTGRPCDDSAGTGDAACDQCLKGQCCSGLAACPEADLMTGQCAALEFCAASHCVGYCEYSVCGQFSLLFDWPCAECAGTWCCAEYSACAADPACQACLSGQDGCDSTSLDEAIVACHASSCASSCEAWWLPGQGGGGAGGQAGAGGSGGQGGGAGGPGGGGGAGQGGAAGSGG